MRERKTRHRQKRRGEMRDWKTRHHVTIVGWKTVTGKRGTSLWGLENAGANAMERRKCNNVQNCKVNNEHTRFPPPAKRSRVFRSRIFSAPGGRTMPPPRTV